MRLHRLEVEGFGPFRTRQVVDFDSFAEDGIFLIAGRTGAGKSSILDAVCFGLYGGVPRYEGGEKRLRSDHCESDDITEVSVEFSTPAGRFRVTRSPEYQRPAKRGGGMTKQPPTAALEEHTDAGWIGRAARAVDVGNALDDILQLTQEQFLQVILLAQNRFARFLLADSKDRQKLLRRLFGTERFEDYQQRFDERRRASEQALGARNATVSALLDQADDIVSAHGLWGGIDEAAADSPEAERLTLLERARSRAEYRVESTGTERETARAGLTAAETVLHTKVAERDAQRERDRARTALDALDAAEPRIAADRDALTRARSAETLRGPISGWRKSADASAAAAQAAQVLRDEWTALVPAEADADAARLRVDAAQRTKENGAWERAQELEAESAVRLRRLADADAAVSTIEAALAAVDEERSALPERLRGLTAERDTVRRDAEQLAERERQVAEATGHYAAAGEVEKLLAERDAAERVEAAATAALGEAVTALGNLRKRRLDGMAGELAAGLTSGEPCAVCGALEHPHPAEHTDPVTADDLAEAESVREKLAAAERTAGEQLTGVRVTLSAAQSRAAGHTVDAARAERDAAGAARDASASARERLAVLDPEIATVEARRTELDDARQELTTDIATVRQERAVVIEQDRDAAAQIDSARGEYDTVAERLTDNATRIAAAGALAAALEAEESAVKAAAEASAELGARLTESSFSEITEVEIALLSASEQQQLDERITDHVSSQKKERAILLDLELRTLPEEKIEVTPVELAARAANAAWQSAVAAATQAESTQQQLSALIVRAQKEHRAGAALADDHAVIENLAQTLAGRAENTYRMNLETFVLAAELEEIVTAANLRLHGMSSGRYQLQHTDSRAARGAASGLGIVVFDAFTGRARPAQSLSGGETFLSSLALALGLAEVVTARAGGIRLDTLFIDEGFGSLDGDTLEVAMRTLDELREGGRVVGVISHVEAMQEQISAQLTVRATANGPSVIDAQG